MQRAEQHLTNHTKAQREPKETFSKLRGVYILHLWHTFQVTCETHACHWLSQEDVQEKWLITRKENILSLGRRREGQRQGEELGHGHRAMLGTRPPCVPCFLLPSGYTDTGSSSPPDRLLLMAVCHLTRVLLLLSRYFYLSRSKACYRLADSRWRLCIGRQAPRWDVRCQHFWEHSGGWNRLKIYPLGMNPLQPALLHYKTWKRVLEGHLHVCCSNR